MNFGTSRASAIEKLNNFVEQNLFEYSRLRNFDYGPNNRSNISCLSPYITHGVISELEVIKKSLNKFSFLKNEKFIQEVLWRTYWKGWLELRPAVWTDYLNELKKIIFIQGWTDEILASLGILRINFAFLDAQHTKEDVLKEFKFVSKRQLNGDMVVFDDLFLYLYRHLCVRNGQKYI